MAREASLLLEVIKRLLNENKEIIDASYVDVDWEKLVSLAKKHNVCNLLYYGLDLLSSECKPEERIVQKIYQTAMKELAVTYNQLEEVRRILETFEDEKIDILAVKGCCTKKHYPQPDYRTMGDIDLLYRHSQHAQMKSAMKTLAYSQSEEGRKHDSYFKPPYINVEMHRELVASDSEYYNYYKNIWEKVSVKESYNYVYEMSLEDEYIFHMAHLTEHFVNGGIGIRFLMDAYVYGSMEQMDWNYVNAELEKLSLYEFHKRVLQLAKYWFGNDSNINANPTLTEISNYILASGVFGNSENKAAVAVAKGGKLQFLFKTVFPNLENMKTMFPWLEKWPVLLPYSWILRGIRSVLFRRKNIKIQMNKFRNGDKTHGKELREFYQRCGL